MTLGYVRSKGDQSRPPYTQFWLYCKALLKLMACTFQVLSICFVLDEHHEDRPQGA